MITHRQKQKRNKPNTLGFTLIEIVIVLGLVSTLMIVLFTIFEGQLRNFGYQQAQLKATGSSRTAMDSLTRNIMQASAVDINRTINSVLYTSDSDAVVLRLPSMNSSYQTLADTFDFVTIYLDGNNLYEIVEVGSGSFRKPTFRLLSDSVNSFTLTYDSATMADVTKITFDITTRTTIRGEQYVEMESSNVAFLRNKPRAEDE